MLNDILLKSMFKINIKSQSPGRLRLKISNYQLLPKEETAFFLPTVLKTLKALKGIISIEANPAIGTILIVYQADTLNPQQIIGHIEHLFDQVIKYLPQAKKLKSLAEIEQFYQDKLDIK